MRRAVLLELTESKLTMYFFENEYVTLLIPVHYSGKLPTMKM